MLQEATVGDVYVDPAVEVEEVTSVEDLAEAGALVLPPTYAPSSAWPTTGSSPSPSGSYASYQPSSASSANGTAVVPAPTGAPSAGQTSSRGPQAYVPETVRTNVVRVSSTLTLGGMVVPTGADELEELAGSLRDAVSSVVSGSLDEKYSIDEVAMLSLGGDGGPTPIAAASVRTRIHQILGRLLRALQASTVVEFQLVVSHACGDDCAVASGGARTDVLQAVASNFFNYPTVQATLRGSGNDALQGVTVEAFAIGDIEVTTEDVEVTTEDPDGGDEETSLGSSGPTLAAFTESPTVSPVTTLAPTSSISPSIVPTLSSWPSFLPTPFSESPTLTPGNTVAPSSSTGPSIVPTLTSWPSSFPSSVPSLAPSYAPTTSSPTSFVCEDDEDFEFAEDDGRVKTCVTYLNTGRPAVLESRCQKELGTGKQVRDFCKIRCGVCEPEPTNQPTTNQPTAVVEAGEDVETAADRILTTVKMPASITLGGIDVPADSGARQEFAVHVEESIESTLIEALDEGYDLEDVKLLYINEEPAVIAAIARKRSRDHVSAGVLRGRALQVSTVLKFEFTFSHVCTSNCSDSIAEEARANVYRMVVTRMFNYAAVQTALRQSGSEVLKEAVVKAFAIGSGIEVTSETLVSQVDDLVESDIDMTSNVTELVSNSTNSVVNVTSTGNETAMEGNYTTGESNSTYFNATMPDIPQDDNSTLLSRDDNSTMELNETGTETELDSSNWTDSNSNETRVLVEFSSALAMTGLIVPQYQSEVQLLVRSLEFGMANVFSEYLSAGFAVKGVSVLSIYGHSDGNNYTLDPSVVDEYLAEDDSLVEVQSMSMHLEVASQLEVASFSMSVAATSLSMHSTDPHHLIGQSIDMSATTATSLKRQRKHRSSDASGRRLRAAGIWRRKRVDLSVHKSSNSNQVGDVASDERYDPFLGMEDSRELGISRSNNVPNHRLFHRTSLGTSLHTNDLNVEGASMSMKEWDHARSISMSINEQQADDISMSMYFDDIHSPEEVEPSMSMEQDFFSMSMTQGEEQSQPKDRTDNSSLAPCRDPSLDGDLSFVNFNVLVEWLCERECNFSADLVGSQVLSEATPSILNLLSVQAKLQESDYIGMHDAKIQGVSIDAAVKVMGESFNFDNLGVQFEFDKGEPCTADSPKDEDMLRIEPSTPTHSPSSSVPTIRNVEVIAPTIDQVENGMSDTTAAPSSSTTSDLTTDNGSLINGTLSPSQAPSLAATLPFTTDLELQDFGSSPAAEYMPLSRCQGDCDSDR